MPADLDAYRDARPRRSCDSARSDGVDARATGRRGTSPTTRSFLGPQRPRATARAALARRPSTRELARAMQAELDAAPGDQRLVLGETAGSTSRGRRGAAPPSSPRRCPRPRLPRDVLGPARLREGRRRARRRRGAAGRRLTRAAARHRAGARRARVRHPAADLDHRDRRGTRRTGAAGCQAMADALGAWADDPRVNRRPVHVPRGHGLPGRPRRRRPDHAGARPTRRGWRRRRVPPPPANPRPARAATAAATPPWPRPPSARSRSAPCSCRSAGPCRGRTCSQSVVSSSSL